MALKKPARQRGTGSGAPSPGHGPRMVSGRQARSPGSEAAVSSFAAPRPAAGDLRGAFGPDRETSAHEFSALSPPATQIRSHVPPSPAHRSEAKQYCSSSAPGPSSSSRGGPPTKPKKGSLRPYTSTVPPAGASQPRGPPKFVWAAVAILVLVTSACMVYLTQNYLAQAQLKAPPSSAPGSPGGAGESSQAAAFRRELASSLILSLSGALHARLGPGGDSGVALVKMLAERSTAAATRKDVAYVTHVRDDMLLARFSPFLLMNVLHAVLHGYAFLLDTKTPEEGGTKLPWNLPNYMKVLCLQRHVGKGYGALAWLEPDAAIVDESDVFANVLMSAPGADVILADHRDRIDDGVVVLRDTRWSGEFLRRWWAKCQAVKYQFLDESALYLIMAEELEKDFPWEGQPGQEWLGCPQGCPPPREVEEEERVGRRVRKRKRIEDKSHVCLEKHMNCRGLAYGNRTHMGHFSALPQNIRSFRINQWFFDGLRPYSTWSKENYFREGDMVARTKSLYKMLKNRKTLMEHRMHEAIKVLMHGEIAGKTSSSQ